ncbi:hypothetical protein AARAC_000011 [Aspergillus arachidicola]|uniref:Uncharacterized protein n=1 Tax=Aspergillus arachidicola TaxID=656916 RepID=A0A2G7FNA9_9EURO|nr:hypothetical protein AARAC_000011 [Aspergillus arachidicola]
MATQNTITVSLPQLAKMIDYSLLHPTMTDDDIRAGLKIAPGTSSPRTLKVAEATAAAQAGGAEIDMVVNIGKVLGGDWEYVSDEMRRVNEAVTEHQAILRVIFENDYLQPEHIARLCEICTQLGVAFVKTSTGYGFVRQPDGSYNYKGAIVRDLKLMRAKSGKKIQVKAAGGVRTLDDLLHVMSLGVTRTGATATVAILEDAKKRGIGKEPMQVSFKPMKEEGEAGGY